MRLVLRVVLPDHPGALSAVAAALGAVGADIASLEVVAREPGIAVDDVCVECPRGPSHVRRALEAVPGVAVEAVRGVERFRDVGAAVDLAAALADAEEGRERVVVLLAGLPEALWATWAAAVQVDRGGLAVLAAAGGVPDLAGWAVPWLPLDAPRPLDLGDWVPAVEREAARRCGLEVAVAPLGSAHRAVVLGRVGGPRFRPAEAHALGRLAHIAARGGAVLVPTARAGPAATAGRS